VSGLFVAVPHWRAPTWERTKYYYDSLKGVGAAYVVVDGEASVRIDEEERASIGRGDFFGEMSLLLGTAPSADVTARTPLRCLVLAGPDLHGFLDKHPTVMYRMLVAMARRLRAANQHPG